MSRNFRPMARAILAVLFFYLVPASAEEAPSSVEGSAPSGEHPYHLVVQGDTLWSISAQYMQNPLLWPSLWELNKPDIANPHRIYPNQKVYLKQKPVPAEPVPELAAAPVPAAEPEPAPVPVITEPEPVAEPAPQITRAQPAPQSGVMVEIGKVVTLKRKAERSGQIKDADKILLETNDELIIRLKQSDKVSVGTILTIFRQREDILDEEGDMRVENNSTLVETIGAAELTEKLSRNRCIAKIIAANTAIEAGDSVRIWKKSE